MGIIWRILSVQLTCALVHAQYSVEDFTSWLEQPPLFQRPVETITDVINDLGVKILQQYGEHGNIAFSPTGAGFVLTALYEGSTGTGKQQIADSLRLPRIRDITRIGLRDIHRRLRTYLSADGFLGGLTLNKEHTRLRPEYEDILRFYGFDLSIDDPKKNETTHTTESTSAMTTESEESSTKMEDAVETTTFVDMTTTTEVPVNLTEAPLTPDSTDAGVTTETINLTSTSAPVTEIPTTTTVSSSGQTDAPITSNVADTQSTAAPATTQAAPMTTIPAATDAPSTSTNPVQTTIPAMTNQGLTASTTTTTTVPDTTAMRTESSVQTTTVLQTTTTPIAIASPEQPLTSGTPAPISTSTNMPESSTLPLAATTNPMSSSSTGASEVDSLLGSTVRMQDTTVTGPSASTMQTGSLVASTTQSQDAATTEAGSIAASSTDNIQTTDLNLVTMQTGSLLASTTQLQDASTVASIADSTQTGLPMASTTQLQDASTIGLTTDSTQTGSLMASTTQLQDASTIGLTTDSTQTGSLMASTTQLQDASTTGLTTDSTQTGSPMASTTQLQDATTIGLTTDSTQTGSLMASTTQLQDASTIALTTDSTQTGSLMASTTQMQDALTTDSTATAASLVTADTTTTNPAGDTTITDFSAGVTTTTVTEDPVIRSLLAASTVSSAVASTFAPSTAPGVTDAATVGTTTIAARATDAATATILPTLANDPLPSANDSANQVRRRSTRSPRGYFSSFPDEGIWMQDLGSWRVYPSGTGEASVRDSTELAFLVNGCDVTSVSAASYTAVLPFAFLPHLKALALEFPLDDPRYNILILLPTDREGTCRLARELGTVTLRELREELQPTWVRATIPSFMLRGYVTLTPFLQRLGIRDVFEPRMADLSPMTPELGVYARDVQQSIGVNIRNYMKPDRTHSRNGLFERAGPISFTAEHPFLYFIIDGQTAVSLIAGRINDPLNSRIL